MKLITVSGFGNKHVDDLNQALYDTLDLQSVTRIDSAPWYRALQHPESIISRVQQEFEKIVATSAPNSIILAGHSYGGLIAACAALRRNLEPFLKIFLIDAPLSPHHSVEPFKKLHQLFFRHYLYRPVLAAECEKLANAHLSSKIVTLAGQSDRIVPEQAKLISGNFENINLPDDDLILSLPQPAHGKGLNIILPPSLRGHNLAPKIPLIVRIIRMIINQAVFSS